MTTSLKNFYVLFIVVFLLLITSVSEARIVTTTVVSTTTVVLASTQAAAVASSANQYYKKNGEWPKSINELKEMGLIDEAKSMEDWEIQDDYLVSLNPSQEMLDKADNGDIYGIKPNQEIRIHLSELKNENNTLEVVILIVGMILIIFTPIILFDRHFFWKNYLIINFYYFKAIGIPIVFFKKLNKDKNFKTKFYKKYSH